MPIKLFRYQQNNLCIYILCINIYFIHISVYTYERYINIRIKIFIETHLQLYKTMKNHLKIRKQNSNMAPISFVIKFRMKPKTNILDSKAYISFKI